MEEENNTTSGQFTSAGSLSEERALELVMEFNSIYGHRDLPPELAADAAASPLMGSQTPRSEEENFFEINESLLDNEEDDEEPASIRPVSSSSFFGRQAPIPPRQYAARFTPSPFGTMVERDILDEYTRYPVPEPLPANPKPLKKALESLKEVVSIPTPSGVRDASYDRFLYVQKGFPENLDPLDFFLHYFNNKDIPKQMVAAIEEMSAMEKDNQYGIAILPQLSNSSYGNPITSTNTIIGIFGVIKNVTVKNGNKQALEAGDVMFIYPVSPESGNVTGYKVRPIKPQWHYDMTGYFNSHSYNQNGSVFCSICFGKSNILHPKGSNVEYKNYYISKLMIGKSQVSWEDLENIPTHSIRGVKNTISSNLHPQSSENWDEWVRVNRPIFPIISGNAFSSRIQQILVSTGFLKKILKRGTAKEKETLLYVMEEILCLSNPSKAVFGTSKFDQNGYAMMVYQNRKLMDLCIMAISYLQEINPVYRLGINVNDLINIVTSLVSPHDFYEGLPAINQVIAENTSFMEISADVNEPFIAWDDDSPIPFIDTGIVAVPLPKEEIMRISPHIGATTTPFGESTRQRTPRRPVYSVQKWSISNLSETITIHNQDKYVKEETQNQNQNKEKPKNEPNYIVLPSARLVKGLVKSVTDLISELSNTDAFEETDYVHSSFANGSDPFSVWKASSGRVERSSVL